MKTYTIEQFEDIAKAYNLLVDNGIVKHYSTLGNIKQSFMNKYLYAIIEVLGLVKKGEYNQNWTANKNDYYMKWLSYDYGKKVFSHNPKRGAFDEWSETLVDAIISEYDVQSVKSWIPFTKTEEYGKNVSTVRDYYWYSQSDYFSHIVTKIDLGQKLTIKEYERFCKNKFAQKVIAEATKEPMFKVGDLADLRTSYEATFEITGFGMLKRISADNGVLILSNTEPIINARKGAKRYKAVALGGTSTPFYIEERDLKKRRMRKK